MSNDLYFKGKDLYICSSISSSMRKQITKVKQMIQKLKQLFSKTDYISYDDYHNHLTNGLDQRFNKLVSLKRW